MVDSLLGIVFEFETVLVIVSLMMSGERFILVTLAAMAQMLLLSVFVTLAYNLIADSDGKQFDQP